MQIAPTITFRRLRATAQLEADIRERLARLETYASSIIAARVVVELAERHHRAGNRVHVRIELTLPGDQIVVKHETSLRPGLRALGVERTRKQDAPDPGHRHAKVAIREAFEAARRRLQDYARRRRGAVKAHIAPPEGRVIRLSPARGFGFIEASDGHEVYFQKTSVLANGFGRLKAGSKVVFVEESGEKGPQASTVRLAR